MRKIGILSLIMFLTLVLGVSTGSAAVLVVDGSVGPYYDIQSAINAASTSTVDTILVNPGTYYVGGYGYDYIYVDKSVIIKSKKGPDQTFVEADSTSEMGFVVTSDNVEINGFTIHPTPTWDEAQYGGTCGVLIGATPYLDCCPWYSWESTDPINGIKVKNCIIEFFSTGIAVLNASGVELKDNHVRYITETDINDVDGYQPEISTYQTAGSGIVIYPYFLLGLGDQAAPNGNALTTAVTQNQIYENGAWGLLVNGDLSYGGGDKPVGSQASGSTTPLIKVHNNTFYNNGSMDYDEAPSNNNYQAMGFFYDYIETLVTNNKVLKLREPYYLAPDGMPIEINDCPMLTARNNRQYNKLISNLGGLNYLLPDLPMIGF